MRDSQQPVFQVTELNEALNRHLSLLGEMVVEGEISRFDLKNGRLIFGSIKDSSSSVDIFSLSHIIKNYRQFEPGMLVHVYATAGLYKGTSKFRLFANQIIPQGEGALQVAFEKLKAQLEAEGLFAPERKRPLPLWPNNIGLVTAPGSSAHADLVKILSTRMGNLHLKNLPVNVQGREAVPSILKAFTFIQHHPTEFDVIIIARGGGSLEDLIAFNSEDICRAIYACKIPVVSAIGHEDNWSLTDFVADVRASTPSNAAELVVRDRHEVLNQISLNHQLIHTRLLRSIHHYKTLVDESSHRIKHRLQRMNAAIAQTIQKIPSIGISLNRLIKTYQQNIADTPTRLQQRLKSALNLKAQEMSHLNRLLSSLDYRNVLSRGYSIARTSDGQILTSISQITTKELMSVQLTDGIVHSTVDQIKKG